MSPTMARSSAADGCTANVGTDDDRPVRRRTLPQCGGGAPTLRAGCAGRRRAWCGRGTAIVGLARPDVGCDSSVPAATDGALVGAAKDDATLLAEEARDTWATVAVSSWVLSPWFDRAMDVPEAEATDAGASTDAADTGDAAGTTAVWEASAAVAPGWETARGTAPNAEVNDAAGTSSRWTVGAREPRVGLPPQAATTCRLRRRVAGLRGAASSTTGAPVAAAACAAASDGVEVMPGCAAATGGRGAGCTAALWATAGVACAVVLAGKANGADTGSGAGVSGLAGDRAKGVPCGGCDWALGFPDHATVRRRRRGRRVADGAAAGIATGAGGDSRAAEAPGEVRGAAKASSPASSAS